MESQNLNPSQGLWKECLAHCGLFRAKARAWHKTAGQSTHLRSGGGRDRIMHAFHPRGPAASQLLCGFKRRFTLSGLLTDEGSPWALPAPLRLWGDGNHDD